MSADVPYEYVDCEVELSNVRWHLNVLSKDGAAIMWDLISARWGIGGRQLDQHEIEAVLRTLDPGQLARVIDAHLSKGH